MRETQSTDASVTGDENIAALGDLVGLALLILRIAWHDHPVIDDKEYRSQQHGQGHDQKKLIGDRCRDDGVGHREGQKHEAELARLCQSETEKPFVCALQLENPPQDQKHQHLDQDKPDGHGEDRAEIVPQKGEVDARPHGHEEKTQKQTLERVDVGFKFVTVFAVGQNDAGKEGAECGREADQRHQERNADHDHQCGSREKLAKLGTSDKAEDRAGQVAATEDHGGDSSDGDKGGLPATQPVDEAEARSWSPPSPWPSSPWVSVP